MEFGETLKLLRKSAKMNQEMLGRLLGVASMTISRYEKGVREPSIENLRKLSKIFNVSADYLIGLNVR